ncbi:hypothetical protein GH714_004572 [Hevea brasiliensis]|uniref:Uncharacterized protein n=1 Tax=Hevea brasiliensis TaxID=3981 RepID=A0A6A6M7H5_HEVBR|nr:hypothetical protein GH714_004572 [Hevea brasiliensis]
MVSLRSCTQPSSATPPSSSPFWEPVLPGMHFLLISPLAISRGGRSPGGLRNSPQCWKANENVYLEDKVTFREYKLMDSDSKAVMMGWEKPLMEAHVRPFAWEVTTYLTSDLEWASWI